MSTITIPPLRMIRNKLGKLTQAQIQKLADDSGVPFSTIMKIRLGITKNPGTETVREFWPLLTAQDDATAGNPQADSHAEAQAS